MGEFLSTQEKVTSAVSSIDHVPMYWQNTYDITQWADIPRGKFPGA